MGMYGEIGAQAISMNGSNMEMIMTLIGRAVAQGDYDKADELYNQGLASMEATDVPKFKELVAQTVGGGNQINESSSGRTAQQGAIDRLQSFVDQNGLDDQARSELQQSLSTTDQNNRANQQAILASQQRKGMSGSGNEIAAQLFGQQAGANQSRNSSGQIAGNARQRALEALGTQGQLAGSMRGQDISVEKSNEDAAREREMFNAKMRMAADQGNNQGHLDYANFGLTRAEAIQRARMGQANRYLQRGKQTQGDYASVGRALNMQQQGAAEGSEDMPF